MSSNFTELSHLEKTVENQPESRRVETGSDISVGAAAVVRWRKSNRWRGDYTLNLSHNSTPLLLAALSRSACTSVSFSPPFLILY